MNQRFIVFVSAFLLLAGLFFFSCAEKEEQLNQAEEPDGKEKSYPPLEPLCEEIKKQIEEDFAKYPIWDQRIKIRRVEEYLGTYNDWVAIIINEKPFRYGKFTDTIDGIPFHFIHPGYIRLWKDGMFPDLKTAYNGHSSLNNGNNFLTKDDLESIAYYYQNSDYAKTREDVIYYRDIDPANFNLIIFEPLCEETESQIRVDFSILSNYPVIYYGSYNNAVVFIDGGLGWDVGIYEVVGGILFFTPTSNELNIWKEGQLYALPAAYDLGLLTINDLMNIAYYLGNYIGGIK